MNERPDHTLYRELLNLELDGCLNVEQRARLAVHLAACPECLAERDQLRAVSGLLERSALAVQPDFKQRGMASSQDFGVATYLHERIEGSGVTLPPRA